jgi:hypothetical protein
VALVHSNGKLDVLPSTEESYVENAWQDVMETFMESLIDSILVANRSVIEYKDMVIRFDFDKAILRVNIPSPSTPTNRRPR